MLFGQSEMSFLLCRKIIVYSLAVLSFWFSTFLTDAFAMSENLAGKAVALLEQKDYSGALEVLHSLEKTLSNPAQISNMLAVAYLGQGYQMLAAGEFQSARDSFRAGRSYNDEDVRLWQGEAITLYRQGNYPEAVSLLDQALGIDQKNPEVYLLLGKAYYAGGRMAEAVDALQRSVEYGGGDEVAGLLDKVRREWQIEEQMQQEYRGHFQLSFVDGEHASGLASDILETLEDAYVEVGSDLAYYPDVRVPVLLYSHRDYADVTHSPDWAGAVYDGKIRLPLAGMRGMTKRFSAILYHEYMHVIVHFMAGRNVPVWLNEGLAELAGRRIDSTPLTDLAAASEAGRLLEWRDLEKPFAGLPDYQVPLAYEQSYSLVLFMVDSYGWHNMAELLESLGKQQGWQGAVTAVYQEYGLDWPAILKEWQANLN
jgi:tetratricopeptide (TPR) repeat protein